MNLKKINWPKMEMFPYPIAGGDEGDDAAKAAEAKAAEEAAAAAKVKADEEAAKKPDELTTKIASAVTSALQPLTQKVDSMEARMVGPKVNDGVSDNPNDKEIELRKGQLEAIERGELDAKYRPEITARLSEAQIKKHGDVIVDGQNKKQDFLGRWNYFLNSAYEEYPELKDTNSELHKEAKKIVAEDPGYQAYLKVTKSKGSDKIDYENLDPRVNLRAAREAAAVIAKRNAGKPLSKQGSAKTALLGKSAPVPQADELVELEKKAVDSGDSTDWQRLIKAREVARKAAVTT